MRLYIVENGQSQRLDLRPRPSSISASSTFRPIFPDLGFSGVRMLKGGGGEGWRDAAIFQGATFFRSLARGQTYGVTARGLSIRTGDPQGEEFPLFPRAVDREAEPGLRHAWSSTRCSIRRA